ncbi:Crp/Fnr family transcriptional regulator [Bradyrhizobium sp. ORS 375]|uniref:Crp/Fnr family transcriptional regulator n=1 Tax=Bradyrhizobium sp. (strain ORS 375) TaxID=566679 RepID=UPI00158528C2|nr:Crp/Fnr family transcriptional regulator [Bradyrhizobium sp. ORS 375]
MSAVVALSDDEQQQIRTAGSELREKGSLIAEDGEHRRSSFLASGWALRQEFLADGRRQISGFLIPGDPLAPFSYLGEPVSDGIVAITPVEIVDVTHIGGPRSARLLDVIERFNLTVARDHLQFYRNQMIRLGCHSAVQRMAHLLLELHSRLMRVGLTSDGRYEFPLTQEMLADALGLSVVHVNRVMKQLRSAGLVQQTGGKLQILNRKRLEQLSEYSE